MISPLMFNIFNIVLNRKHIGNGHFNNIYSCILERDDQIMLVYISSLMLYHHNCIGLRSVVIVSPLIG